MPWVPGDDTVGAGPAGGFDEHGVLIVIVRNAKGILAVSGGGIDQHKKLKEFRKDIPGFFICVLFAGKLFAGEEMDIRSLLGCNAACDLL